MGLSGLINEGSNLVHDRSSTLLKVVLVLSNVLAEKKKQRSQQAIADSTRQQFKLVADTVLTLWCLAWRTLYNDMVEVFGPGQHGQ